MFENVLVCLDGSKTSEYILPYLAAEAGSFKKAVLVKVVDTAGINLPLGVPGFSGGQIRTAGQDRRFQKEMDEMPAYLERMAGPLREKGLDVETVVLEGVPSEAIIAYARDNGIGLIAMATHGHSGLRQVVMGGTAEYIVKHGGRPVLLVTPGK
jgi:nucleotide-binding universal stress UspA family protein